MIKIIGDYMNILFLSNNSITDKLFDWLKNDCNENVIKYDKKIDLGIVKTLKVDFIISYNYRYYISKDIIDYLNNNIINLHISLLPWNKGAYPNVWSFLDETPKGVTIHLVNEDIDGGDILLQKEVFIDESKETLRSSYNLLHIEMQKLFKDNWNNIKNKKIQPRPQCKGGSFHTIADFKKIENIIYSWDMPIRELKKMYRKMVGDNYGE